MLYSGTGMLILMRLVIAVALGAGTAPAIADKPAWAAGGAEKHGKSNKAHKQQGKEKSSGKEHKKSKKDKRGKHFGDHDRDAVRNYYGKELRKGRGCPPGLAKKRNGCMPPGQAKKQWAYGHPLPRDVVYHDLPRQLSLALPAPPNGYRYVRVVADVLLIAIGTGIVVDAIQDLGNL